MQRPREDGRFRVREVCLGHRSRRKQGRTLAATPGAVSSMPENQMPTPNRSFEPTALGKPRSAAQLQRYTHCRLMEGTSRLTRLIIAVVSLGCLPQVHAQKGTVPCAMSVE